MEITFEEITIKEVHKLFEQGQLTSEKLVTFYIDRIKNYDKDNNLINSIIKINPKVIEEAKKLDEIYRTGNGKIVGKLHGIPFIIKDNIETEGIETTAGSISLAGYVPEKDAFIIKKIKDEGGLILAKSNLHEFAIWGETISSILGQTKNPYDLSKTPGGSSGGTGAAIASNFGLVGIGTDTLNSIRSPASANNLVGFRPTMGLVSRDGVIPYSLTQDTVGPICRTVEDCAIVLDVI